MILVDKCLSLLKYVDVFVRDRVDNIFRDSLWCLKGLLQSMGLNRIVRSGLDNVESIVENIYSYLKNKYRLVTRFCNFYNRVFNSIENIYSVLDAGCGTGLNIWLLLNYGFKPREIVFLDIDYRALPILKNI